MRIIILILFISLSFSCSKKTLDPEALNSLSTIINDMEECGDALPHGIPSNYVWIKCPILFAGANVLNSRAVNPWGQLYRTANMDSSNSSTNTRVQIRNQHIYYLSKSTRTWTLWVKTPEIVGAYYREDFYKDLIAPDSLDIRNESDGGISVKMIQEYNFHFFPEGRVSIEDPNDVEAVWAYCEARLIVGDPNLPDDRNEKEYILNGGGDYWIDMQAEWEPSWVTNSDIGMGKFKYVKNEWQAFNMHTTTADVILSNPPPFK